MTDVDGTQKLYTAYHGDIPYKYIYGDDADAMAMFVDGRGFDTAEDAITDYNRRKDNDRINLLQMRILPDDISRIS